MSDKEVTRTTSGKSMASDAMHGLLHFDAKILKTIPLLLFKPGELTVRSLQDSSRYVKPFTLFVFLNFCFFLFKSKGIFHYTLETYSAETRYVEKISAERIALAISQETLEERFNTAMRFEQKEYLIVMVPFFALILHLFRLRKKDSLVSSLTFALNFYSWFIIFLILVPFLIAVAEVIINKANGAVDLRHSESALIWIAMVNSWLYLYVAIRKVYLTSWWFTGLQAACLSFSVIFLVIFIYRPLLFYIVMHSIGE